MCLQKFLHFFGPADIFMVHTLDLLYDLTFFCLQILISFFGDQSHLITFLCQTQVCIVLTQKQTIFCPGCHHTVWFMVLLCYQVIDQNTDISLRTIEDQRLFSFDLHCCIDTGNESLCRRFFISAAAVELSAAEKSSDIFKFQRCIELSRIDTVILDRVGITDNFCMLKPRYTVIHFMLNIFRQRT